MGSSTLLDIVSSMLISGLLLFVALQMDAKSVQNTFDSQASLTVQQNLTSLVESLEYDFRKIGYCKKPNIVPQSDEFIQSGDSNSVSFLSDIADSGRLDTVKYWLGSDTIPSCPNKNVRMLYRQVDSGPRLASNLGITEFKLRYFDSSGNPLQPPIGSPNGVQLMDITIRIEPTASYNANYDSIYAVWRQTRLVSQNLLHR